jgi:hypothetical protein
MAKRGVRACHLIDVTYLGTKIRTHDLSVLPATFNLTFDLLYGGAA